jgi:hypothetical protein
MVEVKKVCKGCEEEKPEEAFKLTTYSSGNKGRAGKCIACQSKYKADWAAKNPEKTKASKQKCQETNGAKYVENARIKREATPEAYKAYQEYQTEWYQDHKEEIRTNNRQYRIDNGDEVRAEAKEYRDTHSDIIKRSKAQETTRLSNLYSRAKKQNLECNLNLDEYVGLISEPCFYCNYEFGQKVLYGTGLDRLNNDLGYVHNNCVSCCRDCNMIRGDYLSPEETKLLISLVLDMRTIGRSSNEVILVQATDIDGYMASNRRQLKQTFRIAQQSPKRHGYAWTLTLEEYVSVIYNPCYYCNNRLGTKVYSAAGLDRVDNSKFYSIDNVVSCCEACNSIKRELLTQNEAKAGIEAVLTFREQNGYR